MSYVPEVTRRPAAMPDLICLSHLRWNFVFQRPHHLMTRGCIDRRVFYIEEPVFDGNSSARLTTDVVDGVHVVVPHLPSGAEKDAARILAELLDRLIDTYIISDYVLWYYTPMALPFTRHLTPRVTVYDCMDELSAFANAPSALKELEAELLQRATFVLTGGQSLYEAKRHAHPRVYPFPSSVDVAHFSSAREIAAQPADQEHIPHPRLGFFGVIDERMDVELLDGVAALRPDWHLMMLGPVVKIDPAALPRRSNIHFLGPKPYGELPLYLAGWAVALIPFARNEATRFISPTKTPEYLAAGVPVVSTSIRDVIRPYLREGLVRIADTPADFVAACEAAMAEDAVARRRAADAYLRHTSWDGTWTRIRHLLDSADAPSREGAGRDAVVERAG